MSKRFHINIPDDAFAVISQLNRAGFESYIVGGCVRDSISGRNPEDWDVATNALPEEVKGLFKNTVDTGIKHGTVTAIVNGGKIEITTYRVEGDYIDNRRPSSVEFAASIEDDLGRRDFTINAMAYHPEKGLIDPFGGIRDMEKCLIRAVGNAEERLREDALRMLRAVRFSAQLNFSLEDGTREAIKNYSYLIQSISKERIRDELTKILISDHPVRFILLRDVDLLQYVLPELEVCFSTQQRHPYHIYNVAMHSLCSVSNIENDRILRWTMLLHDIGKPLTKTTDSSDVDHFYGHASKSVELAGLILNRLRFDNKTTGKICRLIKHHDRVVSPTLKSVRKAVAAVGEDIFPNFLKVKEADKRAQNPEYLQPRLVELDKVSKIYRSIINKGECLSLKDLAINGHDLIELGYRQGREIRTILEKLLDMVIENPELNSSDRLLKIIKDSSH